MNWITETQVKDFIEKQNYDIRQKSKKMGCARWIDQKCTPDVLCIIADCIIEFYNSNKNSEYFSSLDIWHNQYTVENVEAIFKKPNPNKRKAKNEYDKFFQQPMEMFSYAGILEKKKDGKKNLYKIINEDMLQYIAIREMNALNFINLYNTKVLQDSGIYEYFEQFFKKQDKESYRNMKDKFSDFMIQNTKINTKRECNRIFTKVLNPLAFVKNKYGTEKGYISKQKITKDMLMYNRNNFRDVLTNKPKEMTRLEYCATLKEKPNNNLIKYQSFKAKKILRIYNDTFNNGESEVYDNFAVGKAIHMHHIFPENEFSEISGYVENLIALTPTQHLGEAHPNGNTRIVDKAFQQICLLAKVSNIKSNILEGKEVIYSFVNLIFVLRIGLDDDRFNEIEDMDFDEIVRVINMDYICA